MVCSIFFRKEMCAMAVLKQPLENPESGWNRYDDNDSRFSYVNGTWSNSAGGTRDYNTTIMSTSTSNSEVRFNMTGNKLRIICQTWTSFSNNIEVWIDGKLVDSFTTSFSINSANGYRVLVFEKLNIGEGEHFVKLITKQAVTFRFDAVDIDSNATLKAYKEPVSKFLISSGEGQVVAIQNKGVMKPISASASSGADPYPVNNAFDGVTNNGGWQATTTPCYLKYDFAKEQTIVSYKIYPSSNDHNLRSPKNWTFEGSNTGAFSGEQVILDTQSNISGWITGLAKTFDTSNSGSYKYYRLNITANTGGTANYTNLAEWELTGKGYYKVLNGLTESNFLNNGMDRSSVIDLSSDLLNRILVDNESTSMGSGKVFKQKIDRSKHKAHKIILG